MPLLSSKPQYMKAAVLWKTGRKLKIVNKIKIPELTSGQVLVKIAYSGVCHSQLNEIKGLKGEDKFLPHTLGHEGTGVVLDAGPQVTKVKKDDRVIMTWIRGQGMDVPSSVYQRVDGSNVNSGAISTFMNYAVVSENRLVPFSKDFPMDELSLLGCAIPTGAGMVLNEVKILKNDKVVLIGLGAVGLGTLLALKKQKIKNIAVIDKNKKRLNLANKLGVKYLFNSINEDQYLKEINKLIDKWLLNNVT